MFCRVSGKGRPRAIALAQEKGELALKIAIGAIIFAAGIVLILRHIHVWRRAIDASTDAGERRFHAGRLRRRCLSSAGVCVLGIIFSAFAFALAREAREPIFMTILLVSALIIMLLIIAIACLDVIASSHMFIREHQESENAKVELLKEHQRLKKKIQDAEIEKGSES